MQWGIVCRKCYGDERQNSDLIRPQSRWMKGRLGELLEERVRACDRLEPILNRELACKAFRNYRQGSKQIPHFFLYRMACLAVWLDRFQVSPN